MADKPYTQPGPETVQRPSRVYNPQIIPVEPTVQPATPSEPGPNAGPIRR